NARSSRPLSPGTKLNAAESSEPFNRSCELRSACVAPVVMSALSHRAGFEISDRAGLERIIPMCLDRFACDKICARDGPPSYSVRENIEQDLPAMAVQLRAGKRSGMNILTRRSVLRGSIAF